MISSRQGMRLSEFRELLAKAHRRIGRRRACRIGERPDRDVAGIKRHHQKARQEAGEENLDDGDVGLHRIDHHGDRRRDENAERAGAGERAEAHVLVIAALLQFRQRDLGDGGAGRGRRARHRAEHAAGQHIDVHQPARQPVQPRRKAAEHFFRQPRAKQDLAHPDEQRQARRATTTRCCPTPSSPARCRREWSCRRIACRPIRSPSAPPRSRRRRRAAASGSRAGSPQWRATPCQTPLCTARSTISSAVTAFGSS